MKDKFKKHKKFLISMNLEQTARIFYTPGLVQIPDAERGGIECEFYVKLAGIIPPQRRELLVNRLSEHALDRVPSTPREEVRMTVHELYYNIVNTAATAYVTRRVGGETPEVAFEHATEPITTLLAVLMTGQDHHIYHEAQRRLTRNPPAAATR